jgi:hypothetical protein
LAELRHCVPDVDAKMLSSVYTSYAHYAQRLAGQILGTHLLKSTLANLLANLPTQAAQVNTQYGIIRPT